MSWFYEKDKNRGIRKDTGKANVILWYLLYLREECQRHNTGYILNCTPNMHLYPVSLNEMLTKNLG